MNRNSIVAGIGIIVFLSAVGGSLAFIKQKQDEHAAANKQTGVMPETVDATHVREITWTPLLDLVGTVLAHRSITVSNELAGVITTLGFESGAIVEKDAVLATLDDSTDRADLAAAESAVRVARAAVTVADSRQRLAQAEFRRIAEAVKLKAYADVDLERAQAELDRSAADRDRLLAEVDQMAARVEQVKARLAKFVIRAPFRGRAGLRNVHEGQYLAEGAQIVMLQEVRETINVDFAIPQEYIARVEPGYTVMATGALLGDKPVPIRVESMDAAVNYDTRNIRIRSVVDNKNDHLRPGMFLKIRVPEREPSQYIVVPRTAVRRTSFSDIVYILEKDGPGYIAKQRYVKTGPTAGEDIIITEGVKVGDLVATNGSFKLREDAPVAPKIHDAPAGGNADAKPAAKPAAK